MAKVTTAGSQSNFRQHEEEFKQMTENRHSILEPLQPEEATARWVGRDLGTERTEVRGKRILVVEDEPPLREVLRMMLELEGHQVTEASNGAEGLKLFNLSEFDLVITDFEMPVMQGDQLAVHIKLLAPSVPILMITGSGQARCDARNPVDALLSKPFKATDLRGALRKLLPARPEPVQSGVVPALESPSEAFALEEQMVHLHA